MKKAIITPDFIKAVERATNALQLNASDIQHLPKFNEQNEVGNLLRLTVEEDLQTVDLLRGWCNRAKQGEENGTS